MDRRHDDYTRRSRTRIARCVAYGLAFTPVTVIILARFLEVTA